MTEYPPAFTELVEALRQLPSVGPRSAERHALYLLQADAAVSERLAAALTKARAEIHPCRHCGFYAQGADSLCSICANPARDPSLLCVVEDISDLWAIEKTGSFRGYYHVLGGTLSALDGIGPEDLSIPHLVRRATAEGVKEVIIALNATIDGQTSAHYISDCLSACGVSVTQLAHGVPIGGQIDYMDDGTLTTALKSRKAV